MAERTHAHAGPSGDGPHAQAIRPPARAYEPGYRNYLTLSRTVGVLAVILLVVGLGLNLVDLIEPISKIPPVAEVVGGTFESPLALPLGLNIALGVAAVLGSSERALRLRY